MRSNIRIARIYPGQNTGDIALSRCAIGVSFSGSIFREVALCNLRSSISGEPPDVIFNLDVKVIDARRQTLDTVGRPN